MEIQKFRILRPLTYDANGNVITNARDVNWTIPCSGATGLWPLNISPNCSGTTIYDNTLSDVIRGINSDSEFPEKLKDCSMTKPCVIVDDNTYVTNLTHCTNIGGHQYVLFKGLSLAYNGPTYQGSYNELSSIIEGFHTGVTDSIIPITLACSCPDALGTHLNKLPIFISQDYNDIGHYDVWDGNIGQQDTFGNFVLSATSSTGKIITMYRTTDLAYHADVIDSVFTINWGDGSPVTTINPTHSVTHTYTNLQQQQFRITVTQDTPWGSKSVSNVVTIPHITYPVMFNETYSASTLSYGSVPGSGMTSNQVSLIGEQTFYGVGASSAYHNIYGTLGTRGYMPLDSATDIDQFSAMTYGTISADGAPCYTVSGITDSILGNFQTYTTGSTTNLPPGYQSGILVPIGGDVINPITNAFETGVYGFIVTATTIYTAYTISSSYGASGGYANGDTPINLWDFSNGVTIFEAESCGLDKRTFGALECIDCPDDNCEWCQHKDEYVDRVTKVSYQLPPLTPTGLWDSGTQYELGEIVYDITWNACCCYINVGDAATTIGISPSSMMEGVWNGVHMWEGCSDECISCPIGSQSPCNDTTLSHPYTTLGDKAAYYSGGTLYSLGDYVKGSNGNCYINTTGANTHNPTGDTIDWDYIGCVSWDCPPNATDTDCVMVSGLTLSSSMYYGGCKEILDTNNCFENRFTCILQTTAPSLIDLKYQCLGCEEITSTDPRWPTAFLDDITCLPTCSPPAYSCVTPTDANCCVELSCDFPLTYINNVHNAIATYGDNVNNLIGNANLYLSPTEDMASCVDECCVLSSYTWNCEEGCITTNDPGGYSSFNECKNASNNNTNLNQNIQQINPATGSLYASNGTGVYHAVNNNIPCGFSCGTVSEIYNPMPADPDGSGIYMSPCDPCFELGCGSAVEEEPCVTVCSSTSVCYICDCFAIPCQLTLECPTWAEGTTTSYGPNNGNPNIPHDVFENNAWTADTYGGSGGITAYTYSSVTECFDNCHCANFDCVVYRDDHNYYPLYPPDTSVGIGCQSWSEELLDNMQYTWSSAGVQNGIITGEGSGYLSFSACCQAHPDCCQVVCNKDDHPDPLDWTYPCFYYNENLPPYPNDIVYNPGALSGIPPMTRCMQALYPIPTGNPYPDDFNYVCSVVEDCSCACNWLTTWVDSYYFPSPSTGITGTLSLEDIHQGEWDYGFDYESGSTVFHDVLNTSLSSPCCYLCVCIYGYGNPLTGQPLDCSDMEPGTGNLGGQTNCWISCNHQTSDPLLPCSICTVSPYNTYECFDAVGCIVSGVIPSLSVNPCIYAPDLVTYSTVAEWEANVNCYSADTCNNHCQYSCGCNTATTSSQCVQFQDYIIGIADIDVPFPSAGFGYLNSVQCQDSITLAASASACCTTIGVSYSCENLTGCTSDPSTINLPGPGSGCYEIAANMPSGQFHDGNLTQEISPGVYHTFSTALEACESYCTWSCENNNGCAFDPWHVPADFNSAFDCWNGSGQNCDNCNETYFCWSGYTGWQFAPSQIVTKSWLDAQSSGGVEQVEALGQYQISYDMDPTNGFTSATACQEFCRFSCNPTVNHCGCELVWGDPMGRANVDECMATEHPCCFDLWYCMPSLGCTGYYNWQAIPSNPAPNGGPYLQGTGPDEGYTGCTQYCGYVCGDGWAWAGGECSCAFAHTDDLPGGHTNYQEVIHNSPGWNASLNDCNTVNVTNTVGNYGCCDCYNCFQLSISNNGITYNKVDTGGISHNTGNKTSTWTPGGVGTVAVETVVEDADAWAQYGTTYLQGETVVYDQGATSCCYVYNGCCDAMVNICPASIECGVFSGSSSYYSPELGVNYVWGPPKDPHTVWTEYITALGLGTYTSLTNPLQAKNTIPGLVQKTAPPNPMLWTQGPDWIACDPGCPV